MVVICVQKARMCRRDETVIRKEQRGTARLRKQRRGSTLRDDGRTREHRHLTAHCCAVHGNTFATAAASLGQNCRHQNIFHLFHDYWYLFFLFFCATLFKHPSMFYSFYSTLDDSVNMHTFCGRSILVQPTWDKPGGCVLSVK